jgi:hypothetical protein
MAQLKTKDDGTFNQESASSFLWSVDHRDLEYWLGSNAPVILVVVRLSDRLMVWKSIRRTSRKILFDKTQDALTTSSAPALAALVASFGRPGVMVPAMRAEEEIDTSLLRTMFPSEVNIGPTDQTYAEIRWAMLEVEDPPPIDWILHGKRIITFRDIETALFRDIVEPGTADRLPTLTWATIPMAKSLVVSLSICCSAVCRKGCARAFSFTIKNGFSCFLADDRSSARSHTSHIEGVRCATWSRLAGERSTDPARPIIGTLRLRHDLSSSGTNGIWPSNQPTTSRQMATRNIRSRPNA